jgi:hypothetical protein
MKGAKMGLEKNPPYSTISIIPWCAYSHSISPPFNYVIMDSSRAYSKA